MRVINLQRWVCWVVADDRVCDRSGLGEGFPGQRPLLNLLGELVPDSLKLTEHLRWEIRMITRPKNVNCCSLCLPWLFRSGRLLLPQREFACLLPRRGFWSRAGPGARHAVLSSTPHKSSWHSPFVPWPWWISPRSCWGCSASVGPRVSLYQNLSTSVLSYQSFSAIITAIRFCSGGWHFAPI